MKFRIISYNLASFFGGKDKVCRPERCLKVLKEAAPQVAGLQEVANHRPNGAPIVFCDLARQELNMNAEFGCSLRFDNGGTYGNAVLSQYPMERQELFPLPVNQGPDAEPRTALIMKILAPKPFYFVVTHTPYQGEFPNDEELRLTCLTALHRHLVEKGYFPAILTGDLNNPHDAPSIEFLRKSGWNIANDTDPNYPPTVLTSNCGWEQIDYICGYPKNAFQFSQFTVLPDQEASDHQAVTAIAEF